MRIQLQRNPTNRRMQPNYVHIFPDLVTHAGGGEGTGSKISCVCSVYVCLSVRALKGKRLELSVRMSIKI